MTPLTGKEDRRRLTLELSRTRIEHLDSLKREWGLRNRGDVLERLLDGLFPSIEAEGDAMALTQGDELGQTESDLDEQAALVLVGSGALERIRGEAGDGVNGSSQADGGVQHRSSAGIDLPGFVRKRSRDLRDSLQPPPEPNPGMAPMPRLAADLAEQALSQARDHWHGLYGSTANEAVLEAAMTWLAQDVWPQAEPVEGRTFTWTAACALMQQLVDGWSLDAATFERVVVTAGVLEDPFSATTLPMRIPTLIHRFVQRFRRRPKGTSFQTLEHTMTLQGALRLLELPTQLGQRVTLAEIREAYREMALRHHPDSGGSVEAMRRVNEAYQLLKELYRHPAAEPAEPRLR
jgi:hypothetical protein